MAAGGAPSGIDRLPIDITQPEGGYVEFMNKTPAAGVFSFSYYFRSVAVKNKWAPEAAKNINAHNHPWLIYIVGLELYVNLVKSGAPAAGWKVVVYTDQQTLDDIEESMPSPHKERIQGLLADPAVILAKVVWPEYAPFPANSPAREKKVDNAILRTFRLFSFLAFDCPVFVRDADTTYEPSITNTESLKKTFEAMRIWETTFLEQALAKGIPMIYASQPEYSKGFHKNFRLEEDAGGSLGTFAGMVNYIGGIPEMRDIWQDCLSYIRGVCRIIPETGYSSNKDSVVRYIGKDEQILLFVILPAIMDRTFFFYYNFVIGRGGLAIEGLQHSPMAAYKKAFKRILEAFPEQFEKKSTSYGALGSVNIYDKVKNERFFAPPDRKISDFLFNTDPERYLRRKALELRPPKIPGTPPAGKSILSLYQEAEEKVNVSGVDPKTRDELIEEWRAKWAGLLDEEDPIADLRWVEANRGNSLHNPYSVIEAFRNPKYDMVLRIIFEELQRAHRSVCSTKGIRGRYALALKFNEANKRNEEEAARLAAEEAARKAAAPSWPAAPAFPASGAAGGAPRPLGLGAMRPLGLGAPTAFKFGQAKESKGPIGFGGGGRKTKNTKKSRKSNKTRKSKLKRK